jgi:DNA invertase Pin-like site-specific DNA recombinase
VIQCVIVLKLDRAFRNTVDSLQTVEDWERRGVALHIIDLGGNSIDTESPAGRFMLTVLSAAAEMERGMIRDRCNSGRKARQAEGKRIGEVPYGYSLASDGKTLVEDPTEQAGLTLILSLRAQGHTLRYIAKELNQRGFRSKKGGAWTHGQVASVIRSHNIIQRKVA